MGRGSSWVWLDIIKRVVPNFLDDTRLLNDLTKKGALDPVQWPEL